MVVAGALIAVFTFLWIYFLWSRRKYYAFALKMPGPMGLPLLGIAHKLFHVSNILYELPKYAIQNKIKTYFTWIGPLPVIYTIDPKFAEIILTSPDCLDKSNLYTAISDTVGNGILTIKTPVWNHRRKLLNASFSHKVLLGFFPLFKTQISEFCKNLDDNVNCGEIDIKALVCGLTLRTSIATTMGMNFEEESGREFLSICGKILGLIFQRVMNPFLTNPTIYRATKMHKVFTKLREQCLKYSNDLVMNRIKAIESNSEENMPKHNIFIDDVIRHHQNNVYTFDEITSEGNVMVFASFETTASSMYSSLMLLAMHPECQEKVYDELLTAFPDEEFDVQYEDFKKLVYLEMVINETLRIATAIPLIARNCTKDVTISKDLIIPKGTEILIDLFNIQRDKDSWGPDAKEFNPDRFLPSNKVDHHSYSFMPFSRGQRNCIGWQYARIFLKLGLSIVLRKYRFTTKFKYDDIKYTSQITLGYETHPFLEVHKR